MFKKIVKEIKGWIKKRTQKRKKDDRIEKYLGELEKIRKSRHLSGGNRQKGKEEDGNTEVQKTKNLE